MTDQPRSLLIGCGHDRRKVVEPLQFHKGAVLGVARKEWRGELETLDINPRATPDILWDLNCVPWCRPSTAGMPPQLLSEDCYEEVHAYEVLEHLGRQGDVRAFFNTFAEIWRILKPGGYLCATCPSRYSEWLWGDPGHTRAILPASLVFLNQPQYTAQRGATPMSDYRDIYRADFDTVAVHDNRESFWFVLQAVKPSRWEP